MTNDEIIDIKKAAKASDPSQPWGDTLAFAHALIQKLSTEREQWIVVKEHVWDHGDGGRPTLAYLWPCEFNIRVFPSFDDAHSFMKEYSLPTGFVAIKL